MRPSTTIGVALRSFGNPLLKDYEETVRRLFDAGYRVLDFAFVCHNYPNYILREDDWQQRIDRIADLAAKLGVTFSQSHLPYINETMYCTDGNFQKPGYAEYFDECMRRAYVGSAMLGVRYATAHPMSFPEYNFEEMPQLEANRRYYDKFVELGIQKGVGTALENNLPSLNRSWPDRYCTRYEELIRLVDSYNDPLVGIKAKGELQDAIVRLTYENGCYLVKIYEEALTELKKNETV